MAKANKQSSGEASLPLGSEPKLDLDAAKAAEEAELAAMLAEEEAAKAAVEAQAKDDADAKAKAESDAKLATDKAAELEALAERDRLEYEAEQDRTRREAEDRDRAAGLLHPFEHSLGEPPIRTAQPRLVTKGADSSDEDAVHGPRVRVWPHGGLDWDHLSLPQGTAFTVDTRKHSEEAFNALVAAGVLILDDE